MSFIQSQKINKSNDHVLEDDRMATEKEGEDLFKGHLQRLDDSLKCGICHETLDVPLLIKTCGHSCTWIWDDVGP